MTNTFTNNSNLPHPEHPLRPVERRKKPLRNCIESALVLYFMNLEGQHPSNLYKMVLDEVEAPLLEWVMRFTRHNQSKAAEILGINRNTLRKKLKQHEID